MTRRVSDAASEDWALWRVRPPRLKTLREWSKTVGGWAREHGKEFEDVLADLDDTRSTCTDLRAKLAVAEQRIADAKREGMEEAARLADEIPNMLVDMRKSKAHSRGLRGSDVGDRFRMAIAAMPAPSNTPPAPATPDAGTGTGNAAEAAKAERLYEHVRALGFHGPDAKPWAERSAEHQQKWIGAVAAMEPRP